jgi:hypothetical protein
VGTLIGPSSSEGSVRKIYYWDTCYSIGRSLSQTESSCLSFLACRKPNPIIWVSWPVASRILLSEFPGLSQTESPCLSFLACHKPNPIVWVSWPVANWILLSEFPGLSQTESYCLSFVACCKPNSLVWVSFPVTKLILLSEFPGLSQTESSSPSFLANGSEMFSSPETFRRWTSGQRLAKLSNLVQANTLRGSMISASVQITFFRNT